MPERLPQDWDEAMPGNNAEALVQKVDDLRRQGQKIYPPEGHLFTALRLTPLASLRAVILGQDPYHTPGAAMGLAFAVPRGTKLPPSLKNIRREYATDLGLPEPDYPDLTAWAAHGVLLLNTILSVEDGKPLSHKDLGWEKLTDQILQACNSLPRPIAFLLWGAPAQAKRRLLDETKHIVVTGVHPSPLSAYRGFFGSRPFTTINTLLAQRDAPPIDWSLPQDTLL
jgi:uracil-DNA glycosylase